MTPEQIVKDDICSWLERRGALFTLHVRGKMRYSSHRMVRGWPDIHGVWLDGRALMIEVKAKGGTISEDQMRVMDAAKKLGAHAFFAYGLDDVVKYFLGRPA